MDKSSDGRYSELLDELMGLAAKKNAAEATFYRSIRVIEDKKKGIWGKYHETFDELLRTINICDVRLYRDFLKAEKELTMKVVDEIGAPAACEAMIIPEGANRSAFVKQIKKTVTEKGKPFQRPQAKNARKKFQRDNGLVAKTKPTNPSRLVEENRKFREQIKKLQGENQKLFAENQKLTKENQELRKRLGIKPTTSLTA